MAISIRPAGPDDLDLVAWVVLAASRSHVEVGCWDLCEPDDPEERMRLIRALLTAEKPHWCHLSNFLVAEWEGRASAALSAYPADGAGLVGPGEAIATAARSLGWGDPRLGEVFGRLAVFTTCAPSDEPESWIVEWVATRPEARGRGLVQALLEEQLRLARERGHAAVQITILSGNTPAQRAYERAGFAYVDERRSAAFEEATGSAGLLRMLQPVVAEA